MNKFIYILLLLFSIHLFSGCKQNRINRFEEISNSDFDEINRKFSSISPKYKNDILECLINTHGVYFDYLHYIENPDTLICEINTGKQNVSTQKILSAIINCKNDININGQNVIIINLKRYNSNEFYLSKND